MKDDLNERQEEILDIINRNGEGRVNDFRSRFGVTDMTIRRDLEKLEQKGPAAQNIRRRHSYCS